MNLNILYTLLYYVRIEPGLQEIRDLPEDTLHLAYETLVPSERSLPDNFWTRHDETKRSIGLRACLLLWVLSDVEVLPLKFQITATIAIMSGQDSLIDVGTGAGKTLCMILLYLLSPAPWLLSYRP